MSKRIKNHIGGISLRIKSMRKIRHITQYQLAEALHKSESAVRMWELGKSEPDAESLCAMSKIFNISTDYLLGMPYTITRSKEYWHESEINKYECADEATKEYLLYKLGNAYFEAHSECTAPISPSFTVPIDKHESDMLISYRNHPEMQAAIDKILGVDGDSVVLYSAASSSDNHAPEIVRKTQAKWQKIENAPDTDSELI